MILQPAIFKILNLPAFDRNDFAKGIAQTLNPAITFKKLQKLSLDSIACFRKVMAVPGLRGEVRLAAACYQQDSENEIKLEKSAMHL
jgi:hypothetical protein